MLDVLVLTLLVVLFCWWRPWQHRKPPSLPQQLEPSTTDPYELLAAARRTIKGHEQEVARLTYELDLAQRGRGESERRFWDLQKWACEIRVGFGRLLVEHHRNPVPMMENGMCRFCTSEEWAGVVSQLRSG
jgi:hypothetical protein